MGDGSEKRLVASSLYSLDRRPQIGNKVFDLRLRRRKWEGRRIGHEEVRAVRINSVELITTYRPSPNFDIDEADTSCDYGVNIQTSTFK